MVDYTPLRLYVLLIRCVYGYIGTRHEILGIDIVNFVM